MTNTIDLNEITRLAQECAEAEEAELKAMNAVADTEGKRVSVNVVGLNNGNVIEVRIHADQPTRDSRIWLTSKKATRLARLLLECSEKLMGDPNALAGE